METNIILSMYANGREQGYHLHKWDSYPGRKVSFSENRNSDDIVIYFGDIKGFTIDNKPTEKTWKENRKFFKYNEIYNAAKWIVDFLTNK